MVQTDISVFGDGCDDGALDVNFEVADLTRPMVAVGELQRRGMTVVMRPRRHFLVRGRVAKPTGGSLELVQPNGA